jgi:hypothetical protein
MSADAKFEELARALDRAPEMKKQVDAYGVALMMIRAGTADPKKVANDVLEKWGQIAWHGVN